MQNKLLYAATDHTAAELIVERADPHQPNMALTRWSGSRVRKGDVIIAKNYLTQEELDVLNRLVVIFLEQADLRVRQHKDLTLDFWRTNVERMLEFNDQNVLKDAGSVSHDDMKRIAHQRYEKFDANRYTLEAAEADAADLREIEQMERQIQQQKPEN